MAHKKYGWRIAGFIFKGLCTALILGIIGLLAWRIIDRSIDPQSMKTITANDKLCGAYLENDKELTILTQEQNEYTQENHNYGYFANGGTLFIDEADQVQFVLRYNKSTLEHVAKDFELPKVPSREENIFDVSLVIMYDLTPENDKDNDGKTPEAVEYVRISPSGEALSYQKTLYNYHKYVFDGVEVDKSVLAIYVDIYYVGKIDYNERSLGTLLIYDCTYPTKEYTLTKNDIKAIADFAK
jgi:hypothetical protein